MIRVATLFTRLHIGGDENRVLTFAKHYDRSCFEHQVIVMVDPEEAQNKTQGPMAHRYKKRGIPCHFMGESAKASETPLPKGLLALRDTRRFMGLCLRLARYLKAQKIDVVDARMAHAVAVGLVAGRLAGAAVVATEYYDNFWKESPWRQLGPSIFGQLDALICDSQACLTGLQSWAPTLKNGVVIRNGIEIPQPTRCRKDIRGELNIPEGARLMAQISRIVPYKGHRILLKAAAEVMKKHRDVYLLLCGYAGLGVAYEAGLWDLARALGIAERVRIMGYPGPIADIWGAVDVHVHASELDSAPLAIHEAMALGLPSVVSTAGGIPELIEDGRTALLVPMGEWRPLAQALLRLLENPQLSQRLGDAAHQRYQRLHQPAHMAEKHCSLFRAVLETRQAVQKNGHLRRAVDAYL